MNKIQKYISVGILVLVLAGVGWQYAGWQKQVQRHKNALDFWQVQVPKVQAQYPEFQPQDITQKVAEENEMFAAQQRTLYVNLGVILLLGILASGAVWFVPSIAKKQVL